MTQKAKLGLIGLAVMGANLARNAARNGFTTCVYNRTYSKTENFMKEFGNNSHLVSAETLEELVGKLEKPRKILLMIKAGEAVDKTIEQILPLIEKGDIIIDGGNSYYKDTQRREKYLSEKGIEYVGMGVSGGEEGALNGPSLMPGANRKAYNELKPILEAISAKANGEPCVDYIGKDGAGHYVKTVHNGIEYADMQMIADVYMFMKEILCMTTDEMANTWEKWNKGKLSSYLVEITSQILRKKDDETGKPMVDVILDKAMQKGTGKWTSLSALELGTAAPTITEAVFARIMSSNKEERTALAKIYETVNLPKTDINKKQIIDDLENALYGAKICAYAQGFNLIAQASKTYDWDVKLGNIAKIWRNGCIIRAGFLDRVTEAYEKQKEIENLLFTDYFAKALKESRAGWGRIVSTAVLSGVAVPALGSALQYFDAYRKSQSGASLIQAQRDYFGAHTYERNDKKGTFHTEWF